MGERVVVNPAVAEPQPEPRRVVPLGYGQNEGRFTHVDRAVRRTFGGWRRVGFAFGVCFASGGIVYALTDGFSRDEASFFVALGGLLIGLTVPCRGLDGPPAESRGQE
jgi:hypothetical protein